MGDLACFQQSFGWALLEPARAHEARPALDLALRIHRNTAMKGLVDALAANYPTIVQLVGEEWFRGCALAFVRANPAHSPVLALYGETFPRFLSSFPPAHELPYLADVARIDRLWIESYFARDASSLSCAKLARLAPEVLNRTRLSLHPATRLAWVGHSAATVWIHHRTAGGELACTDEEEGLLLTRREKRVEYWPISRAAHDFLALLTRGNTMGAAAEAMLDRNIEVDIAAMLATTLAAGAFVDAEGMNS